MRKLFKEKFIYSCIFFLLVLLVIRDWSSYAASWDRHCASLAACHFMLL